MMKRHRKIRANEIVAAIACFALILSQAPRAAAQVEPSVTTGVQFLRARIGGERVGETALGTLALLKAEVPENDPAIQAGLQKILSRFTSSGYLPERTSGHDIYEAAVITMALANCESAEYKGLIGSTAAYILAKQKSNGSWDYPHRSQGDCSISQYAVLGLWEADNAGVSITPSVWDRAAQFYLANQLNDGSWNYHPDDPNVPPTISMTAAGVGSLLICRRQIDSLNQLKRGVNPSLTPLVGDSVQVSFQPRTSLGRIDEAVRRGLSWISSRFAAQKSAVFGQSVYYGLYGIERIGALADRQTLGRIDWFERGKGLIDSSQSGGGSWNDGTFGEVANTSWAILFLTRSTAKSIRKITIRKLGAGTLLGGRGLPKDLSSLTVAGGRVVSRPMSGAVEGMLAVLEDPRAENADAAVSGLYDRYQAEGARALIPHKARFLRMRRDQDPGVRRVAVWAIGHTGELESAPLLIESLMDPDESVVTTARVGLQILSRKIDGLGPPTPSTPEQRRVAADAWKRWYLSIRPLNPVEEPDSPAESKPSSSAGLPSAGGSIP